MTYISFRPYHLKPGKLVSILINNQVFQSRVEEIKKDQIILSAPINRGYPLKIGDDWKAVVYVSVNNATYSFVSPILGYSETPAPLITVQRPTRLKEIEQRLWDRVPMILDATYSPVEENLTRVRPKKARSVNISGNGVLLECSESVVPDSLLRLLLSLPSGKRLRLTGKVVRVSINSEKPGAPYKVAVEFKDISEKNRENIMRLIFFNQHKELLINRVVSSVEKCKNQVFDIYQGAGREYEQVKQSIIEKSSVLIKMINELQDTDSGAPSETLELNVNHRYGDLKDVVLHLIRDLERHADYSHGLLEKSSALTGQLGIILNFMYKELEPLKSGVDTGPGHKELVWRVVQAQEEERKRIARDIHDGPAQVMANIYMHLDYCYTLAGKDLELTRSELRRLQASVKEQLGELRSILFDLRPRSIDEYGLVYSLERYFNEFENQHGIKVVFNHQGLSDMLNPLLMTTVFRVVQESLNNARKHAHADEIKVTLNANPSRLNLEISDNGMGFEIREGVKEKSFGLGMMRERVEMLSGSVVVRSRKGAGTTVLVNLPLR